MFFSECVYYNIHESGIVFQGEQEGRWMIYYTDGEKQREGFYLRGKQNGRWTGLIIRHGTMTKIEADFVNGHLWGKVLHWSGNGTLLSEENYIRGKRDGIQRRYFPNGVIDCEENWSVGDPDGKSVKYYEDGKKKLEGLFDQGQRIGTWTYFYERGMKSQEVVYGRKNFHSFAVQKRKETCRR